MRVPVVRGYGGRRRLRDLPGPGDRPRLIAAGALVPDLVDVATGGRWFAHTLVCSVSVLVVVMVSTQGRRLRRGQLLAPPIGMFLHLVFDGMWADRTGFWWPFLGGDLGRRPLPSVERALANVPLDLLGLAAIIWMWRPVRLGERERRGLVLKTGRFSHDLA